MRVISWLLDLLYPPKCVICGKLLSGRGAVCPACMDALPEYDDPAPRVGFTSGGAVSFYYEDAIRTSFHRFKFGGCAHYAATYGQWMAHTITDRLAGQYDCICWAPISHRRRRGRGYDQSELLCRRIAAQLGLQPLRLLRRVKDRPAQSSLPDAARRCANVSGAYEANPLCAGRRVLLIDDIVTTGATLSECSRVLRTAGVADVVYAAFAAPRKQN